MSTAPIWNRLQSLSDRFNARAKLARSRHENTPIAYLYHLNVYRSAIADTDGNETDLSVLVADFDFYRNCGDTFAVVSDFSRHVEEMGLRLVKSGVFTSEMGGGDSFHIEI